MNFSIAGNAMQSSVTLELRYDSLNVAWMKNENGRLQERKFLSAVLDGLVLKHSNPDSQGMRTVPEQRKGTSTAPNSTTCGNRCYRESNPRSWGATGSGTATNNTIPRTAYT